VEGLSWGSTWFGPTSWIPIENLTLDKQWPLENGFEVLWARDAETTRPQILAPAELGESIFHPSMQQNAGYSLVSDKHCSACICVICADAGVHHLPQTESARQNGTVWLGLTSDLGWSGGIQIQPKHWKWPFQLTVSNRNVSRIHSQYFALPMCSDAFQFAKSQLSTSRGLNCRLMARPRSGTRRRSSVQCPWPLEGCPRPWGHGSYSEVMNL
jgi:hypothetical protein